MLWLWKFIQNAENRATLAWIGGGIAGAFALVTYFFPLHSAGPATPPGITFNGNTVINGSVSLGSDPSQIGKAVAASIKPLVDQVAQLQAERDELKRRLDQEPPGPSTAGLQQEYDRVNALVNIGQTQLQAVQLIDAGDVAQAITLLDSAEKALDRISVGSSSLDQLQRGYNYKTYAQAFLKKREIAQATRYMDLALNLFELVRDKPDVSNELLGSAIHGLGNIEHLRGNYQAAITNYQRAIMIFPNAPYTRYDLFLAYAGLADSGDVRLAPMREALDQIKKIDGIDPSEVAALEEYFARYQR